ncbi:MAG: hypothetical protein GZ094_13260 [Mariniphaga sp.]|nr:hypothetical protein [Mariniphaga sp.]
MIIISINLLFPIPICIILKGIAKHQLIHKGGETSYYDPYIPIKKTSESNSLKSIEPTKELLQNADCVVLTTNHNILNADIIIENSKLTVDLRNVL